MKRQKTANLFALLTVISMLVFAASSSSAQMAAVVYNQAAAAPQADDCAPPAPPRYWCVSNVTPSSNTDVLSGVSVLDYNNIWAVGTTNATIAGGTPLAQRWVGTGWLSLSVAITAQTSSSLNAVAASGTGNSPSVWAVGASYQTGQGCSQCILVEHANNSGFTRVGNLINKGLNGNSLAGVMAVDGSTVWAVGGYNNDASGNDKVLIERCTLSGCNPVDDTNLNHGTGFNYLRGIAGVPSTAYAVGYWSTRQAYNECNQPSDACRPLLLKGTGTNGNYSWSRVDDSLIDFPTGSAYLNSVDWFNANDIWAVGSYYDNNIGAFRPLVLHYDGIRWNFAQNMAAEIQTDSNTNCASTNTSGAAPHCHARANTTNAHAIPWYSDRLLWP